MCRKRNYQTTDIIGYIKIRRTNKRRNSQRKTKKNTKLLPAIKAFMQHHKYKPNNNMYRIIGECLCVMKFIDEDVIKGWEDKVNKKEAGQYFYPLVSYVKQMYLKVRAKAL